MLEDEYITLDEYQTATATTWEEMKPSRVVHPLLEPHFTFRVQREMVRILTAMGVPDPEHAVRTGGYRITTTLDYPLQQVARAQVQEWVAALPTRTFTTARWWRSTPRRARSSPISAASTTTTRPTRGSRASSTLPASLPPPAGFGLQADRLHLGLQGAHGDGIDDVRGRPDELRHP